VKLGEERLGKVDTTYQLLRDIGPWLRGLFFQPRLRISYDPTKSKDKAYTADAGMRLACYYHLQVLNEGRGVAKRCKPVLETVESLDNSSLRLRKPEQMHWANEPTLEPVDIERNQARRLDLVFLFQDDRNINFFIPPPPIPVGTTRVFPPGRYRVRVRVTPEAGKPGVGQFTLLTDGTWDALEITTP